MAAAITFQSVVSAGATDSAGQVAVERLRSLGIVSAQDAGQPPQRRP